MRLRLEKSPGTRVIIVRHGESTFNALGLYQGSSDESVLTETGRREARITGEFLSKITFDSVYISPLKRAQETAKEILDVINVPKQAVFITDKLRENDLPHWEGLSFRYVQENFPAAYQIWKQLPHLFWIHLDGETQFYPALSLYERVQEFWQEILPSNVGKTLLIIAHGGTNRALISTALGISPAFYHNFKQSNCGISVVNFANGYLGSGQLEVMNLNHHLENLRYKRKEKRIFQRQGSLKFTQRKV